MAIEWKFSNIREGYYSDYSWVNIVPSISKDASYDIPTRGNTQ